ncbi:hypothetical protein GCM10007874_72780 [Labrys miyagiensis]|uniref:Uncharacterized protein n=2 Tax=Labrys miyagiensis TaxID=346912 RepID=A0ABQ6CV88_9HYPH|nr:hypothetical protein GCM10007874_72780 [Labrys miyagiensis]
MKEYLFDAKLFAALRVEATSEAAARKLLEKTLAAASVYYRDSRGKLQKAEASLAGDLDLVEEDAAPEAPAPKKYTVRAIVTARVAGYTTITALSDEDAIKKAGALDPSEVGYEIDEDFMVEGDQSCFLESEEQGEKLEVDLRPVGEPYSWDCVNLVKDLANLADFQEEAKSARLLIEYAKRAKGLLKTTSA